MTTEEKKDQQVAQKPAEPEKVMTNSGLYQFLGKLLLFRLKKLKNLNPSLSQNQRKKKRGKKPNLNPKKADKEINGERRAEELIKLKTEIRVMLQVAVKLVVLIKVVMVVVFDQEKTLGAVEM